MRKAVLGGLMTASLVASPAFAQSSSGRWNGLSDRFQIDTGDFRLSTETQLRYNGGPGSGDIDFEKDRNAGLGVQYKYNRYSYDRGILISQLGGEVTYQGLQVFLSFLF